MSLPSDHDAYGAPPRPRTKVRIEPRDRRLFALFRDVRFLRTGQLEKLVVAANHDALFPTTYALRRRIQLLLDAGYLEHPETARYLPYRGRKRPANRPEAIWALSTRAAQEIRLSGDFSKNNGRLRSKQDPFTHALAIAEVYTALTLGDRSGVFEFADWHGENARKFKVALDGTGTEKTLSPDGSFMLRDPESECSYFLEVDCDSEPYTRTTEGTYFDETLRKHEAYWRALMRADRESALLVLVVAPSERRAASLRERAVRIDRRGKGLNIFYFTSFERWSLDEPAPFWSRRIWTTASGEQRRLFE